MNWFTLNNTTKSALRTGEWLESGSRTGTDKKSAQRIENAPMRKKPMIDRSTSQTWLSTPSVSRSGAQYKDTP